MLSDKPKSLVSRTGRAESLILKLVTGLSPGPVVSDLLLVVL